MYMRNLMSNSYRHAVSSSRKWGGTPEDYIAIHEFIDGTKQSFGDVRHRALLHNTWGCWVAQEVFGRTVTIKRKHGLGTLEVPVREIVERHIIEDLGCIPSVGDWLNNMEIKQWMGGPVKKKLSREGLK